MIAELLYFYICMLTTFDLALSSVPKKTFIFAVGY